MKSLLAIFALYIIFATSGSKAGIGGQEGAPNQVSYGQNTGYRQSRLPTTANSQPKVDVQLTHGTGTQLDIYKKSGESEDNYYSRILAQRSYELYTEYLTRIEILKVLLPDLPIWNNGVYYAYWSLETNSIEPKVKELYLPGVGTAYPETNAQYYKRIFQKDDDENLNEYIRRICVMRTKFPTLSVWGNNAFIEYVKPNLIAYQKDSEVANKVTISPGSPGSFSNSRIQSSSVAHSSSGTPINPTILSPSTAASSTPVSPTASNPVLSQQTRPVTTTDSSLNRFPANSPDTHRMGKKGKHKKLNGGEYAIQEGETEEMYCKRLLQTDVPLSKRDYNKRIKKTQESY